MRALVGRLQGNRRSREGERGNRSAEHPGAHGAAAAPATAVSLFDQATIYAAGDVTAAQVREMLGLAHTAVVAEFVDTLARRDTKEGLRVLAQAADQGLEMRQFARETIRYLRGTLLHKSGMEAAELLEMSEEEATLMDGLAGADPHSPKSCRPFASSQKPNNRCA